MATPKLRFKEFDGEWSKSSILDLSKEKALNNGVFNDQNKVGKGYKLINVLDMYIERDIDEARLSLLDLDAKEFERNKVKYGDIFFTRSSLVKEGIAFSNVYLGNANDVTYDGHLIKLSPNLERIDPIFLNFSLKTENVRKQLIQGGKTATMTTIGQKEVGGCQLDIPSKKEQTKIASFLSAVDEKISQLTQKHELLSQYKQGMMQKLFSQQIRFKADDGSEFGEWKEKKLSEICLKIKDGTHFSPKTFEVGEYKYLTSKNVKNGYLDFSNLEFVSADDHKKIYSSCDVKFGDVLLTKDGTIGQCCVNTLTEEFSLLSSVAFLRLKSEFNNYFLYHILLSDLGQKEINGVIAGQALKRITLTKINDFKFMFPCLEEQTKIANFLSAIDQKIDVVVQQIGQAKTWKKGSLQQMFV
ncbi:restriction endonuclease subunit S [Acinetobacter johnsonii]|uniref:restriction endonuclease subunit S n=1 Tax=Acinetobacter johnsonii TaxID=40214 RepID=UPI0024491539|nr:restriction endonuclease subunit S [Acinetobacter johnsonii]MDH1801998.1 restriction endonuclease subunit S [Acinetobacter johnsonii]